VCARILNRCNAEFGATLVVSVRPDDGIAVVDASEKQARVARPLQAALNYFAYNFIKIHTTLRTSPAMAAGTTDRLFDLMDLVKLLIESEREKPRSC
jgi:hypothetical protein